MKAMMELTVFDGGDPTTGEKRIMTIGELDPAALPDSAAAWVHDVVARMLRLPPAAVVTKVVPLALWDDIPDGSE